MDHDVEICAIQLPGRSTRIMEEPYTSFSPLIEALGEVIAEEGMQAFSFFGHSLGALVAFELAHHCERLHLSAPERLIVSGCNAPQRLNPPRYLHMLPDDELIAELKHFNGTPDEVLEHRELMNLVLPAIRADFSMVAQYRYLDQGKLNVPIVAFGGRNDPHCSREQTEAWRLETSADFSMQWFEGDHFFINDEKDAVLVSLKNALRDTAERV
jgi:medium-chain acyl-[acyl-carrier-protein] hydrolase